MTENCDRKKPEDAVLAILHLALQNLCYERGVVLLEETLAEKLFIRTSAGFSSYAVYSCRVSTQADGLQWQPSQPPAPRAAMHLRGGELGEAA